MIYGVIIYIGFVLIFGLNNYLRKEHVSQILKGIHLFIGLLLFLYYFVDFRNGFWGIFQYGVGSLYTTESHEKYSETFDILTSVAYLINCAFMSGLALNMAIKAKSRKLFLYSSPLVVFITSADLFKVVLNNSEIEHGSWGLFIFVTISIGVLFGLMNLYLNTLGKRVFV